MYLKKINILKVNDFVLNKKIWNAAGPVKKVANLGKKKGTGKTKI